MYVCRCIILKNVIQELGYMISTQVTAGGKGVPQGFWPPGGGLENLDMEEETHRTGHALGLDGNLSK